jgi:hypothetical protein
MLVKELVEKLQSFNGDAQVKLMGSVSDSEGDLDDVQGFDITFVHDE